MSVTALLRAAPVLVLFALAACESDGPPSKDEAAPQGAGPAGPICRYGKRPENVFVATQRRNGAAYKGDLVYSDLELMETNWFGRSDKRIASAVAAPSINVWSVNVAHNCYDARRKVYYACTKVLKADLSNIRALVRSVSMTNARKLAKDYCEQRVLAAVDDKIEERIDHRKLRCRVVATARCDPPPKPAAPAKKQ